MPQEKDSASGNGVCFAMRVFVLARQWPWGSGGRATEPAMTLISVR